MAGKLITVVRRQAFATTSGAAINVTSPLATAVDTIDFVSGTLIVRVYSATGLGSTPASPPNFTVTAVNMMVADEDPATVLEQPGTAMATVEVNSTTAGSATPSNVYLQGAMTAPIGRYLRVFIRFNNAVGTVATAVLGVDILGRDA